MTVGYAGRQKHDIAPGVQEVDLFLALLRLTSGGPAACHSEWNDRTQFFLIRSSTHARDLLAERLSHILARPFDVVDQVWIISQEEAFAVIAASGSEDMG